MCLIIHKPAGVEIPGELIRSAWEDNPDGAGIMYMAANGPVIHKIMPGDCADPARYIETMLAGLPDKELGVHFRWKTHGPITRENTHPFQLPGAGGYLMHNGVISDKTLGEHYGKVRHTMSDTAFYTMTALAGAPGADKPEFWEIVGQDIGSYNKFLVMDAAGRFLRVNEKQWWDYRGLKLSNMMSCPEYQVNYGTGTRGWRNRYYDLSDSYPGTLGSGADTSGTGTGSYKDDAVVIYLTEN